MTEQIPSPPEDIDKAMQDFGPAYHAHWKAWLEVARVEFMKEPLDRMFQIMEVEKCTLSMLAAIAPGLLPELEHEMAIMRDGLLYRCLKESPRPIDIWARIQAARIDHWRVFPHPPGMNKPEGVE